MLRLIQKTIALLSTYPLCFFAPAPDKQMCKDGFYNRIDRVDTLMPQDLTRVYIHNHYRIGRYLELDQIGPARKSLAVNYESAHQKILMILICFLSGKVYFHSLYTVYERMLHLPFIKVFFEPHGIVPEEEKMRGNDESAARYEKLERQVMMRASVCVVVSDAMRQHFQDKYPEANRVRYITFPTDGICCSLPSEEEILQKSGRLDRPVIVYAGGMQEWQLIDEMQDLISATSDRYEYRIFVPNPAEFHRRWGDRVNMEKVIVDTKNKDELIKEYETAHFGLILRDDHRVNRVACPTKMIEYLSHAVIPIVKFPRVGDFEELGYAYLSVDDFRENRLPDREEWLTMIRQNFDVARKIQKQFDQGKTELLNEMIKH